MLLDFLASETPEARKASQQITGGKYGELNKYFREQVVPAYKSIVSRQKAVDATVESQRKTQEEATPTVPTGAAAGPGSPAGPEIVNEDGEISDSAWGRLLKQVGVK
jgi:hypothetical protein